MFESKRRAIVVPQHEHARLAGEIAYHWGNGTIPPPPISPRQLAAGVANHDRGYPPLDRLPIGGTTRETWLETQARGVDAYHPDPLVDLIALKHLQRLVSGTTESAVTDDTVTDDTVTQLLRRIENRVADRITDRVAELGRPGTEGDVEILASDIDTITRVADMISFWLSFEVEGSGTFPVYAGAAGNRTELTVTVTSDGTVEVSPWPLSVPQLNGFLVAYQSTRYPTDLVVEVIPFHIKPTQGLV